MAGPYVTCSIRLLTVLCTTRRTAASRPCLGRVSTPYFDDDTILVSYVSFCIDFDKVKDRVKEEMAENKEREARREREHALQNRLEEVKSTWTGLRAQSDAKEPPELPIPPIQEFRQLPVVKIYEKPGPSDSRSLTDSFATSVLAENLDQWRNSARAALAGVLGFPGWKAMSKKKLHPVDRLTARFRCKRCDGVVTENKVGLAFGSGPSVYGCRRYSPYFCSAF